MTKSLSGFVKLITPWQEICVNLRSSADKKYLVAAMPRWVYL
jgi:hypothetical protein